MFKIAQIILLFLFACQAEGTWIPPDEALEKLMKGNERYINEISKFSNRSQERREETIHSQEPFAAIISCSDSRGSPDIIFDQGIGDIFVVRVAGNVIGPIELASLEYSAIYLNSSLIMVLGHENCGAVKAVLEGKSKDIEPIAELIAPAIEMAKCHKGSLWENAIKDNAIHFVKDLRANPALADLINKGRLKVVGAYYSFTTGKVEIITN